MEWDEKDGNVATLIYLPQKEFKIHDIEDYSVELLDESTLVIIEPTGHKRSIKISLY